MCFVAIVDNRQSWPAGWRIYGSSRGSRRLWRGSRAGSVPPLRRRSDAVESFREPRPLHRRHDVWVTILRTLAGIITGYDAVQFYPYVNNDSSYLCSV